MSAPMCPRCGYDQSGAVAAWERNEPACSPLTGVCSECGLEFAWRDLLNPVYAMRARFFEHARSEWLVSLRLTMWRVMRPWVFWRWIRMEHRIAWIRLLAFVPIAVALVYAAVLALNVVLGLVTYLGLTLTGGVKSGMPFSATELVRFASWPLDDVESAPLRLVWLVGRSHLRVSPSAEVVLIAAVLMPLAFLLLPATLRRSGVRRSHLARIWLYGLVALPAILCAHMALRVTLEMIWTSMYGTNTGGVAVPRIGEALDHLKSFRWRGTLLLGTLWLFVWWTLAAGWYLRLPRPLAIGAAMTIMSVLGATAIVLLEPGAGTRLMSGW